MILDFPIEQKKPKNRILRENLLEALTIDTTEIFHPDRCLGIVVSEGCFCSILLIDRFCLSLEVVSRLGAVSLFQSPAISLFPEQSFQSLHRLFSTRTDILAERFCWDQITRESPLLSNALP
jgi:hypothetical protein